MKIHKEDVFALAAFLVIVGLLSWYMYEMFLGDCADFGWVPAKHVPARCFIK